MTVCQLGKERGYTDCEKECPYSKLAGDHLSDPICKIYSDLEDCESAVIDAQEMSE